MDQYEEIYSKLVKYNQTHLLKYWNDLTTEQKSKLHREVLINNFTESDKFIFTAQTSNDLKNKIDFTACSLKNINISRCFQFSQSTIDTYELEGLKTISNGHVAIISLAGGSSSRLSISYPKGMYSVDLLSSKSLFQIQAERIIRIKTIAFEKFQNVSITLPWYIMTSKKNHAETKEFFKENDNFGLKESEVILFSQEMFPIRTLDNKITMASKTAINTAPNGSGGLYQALIKNRILEDMTNKGIKYVHVNGVENLSVKMADPFFTGHCVKNNIKSSAKMVFKQSWNEPINRLVFKEKVMKIVDYSLVSKQSTQSLLESDERSSIFSLGDIGSYFIEFGLLNDLCRKEHILEVYKFEKSVSVLNDCGKEQKQRSLVFEKFFTDLLPEDTHILEVERKREFSPLVYMSTGEPFNRYSCKKDLMRLHYSWLINAGARFHNSHDHRSEIKAINHRHDESSSDDLTNICEISPLVSYSGENLDEYVKGKSFEPPLVLELDPDTKQVTFNGLDFKSYNELYPTDHLIRNNVNSIC